MIIESTSNPKFKFARSLQKSRTRKKEGRFLMEGRPELDHALAAGLTCDFIGFCSAYIGKDEIEQLLEPYKSKPVLFEFSRELFDALTYQHVPGNFFGVFHSFSNDISALDPSEHLLILEQVEKPGNLGAILRTCDALGVKQVLCTETALDLFNPNVLRNARGAVFNVKCVFGSNNETLAFLEEYAYTCFTAALHQDAIDYRSISDGTTKKAIILGSESDGLSPFWLNAKHQKIIIPMQGVVDSLNVSVSAAILMSELFR